jgi:hypothetical protein
MHMRDVLKPAIMIGAGSFNQDPRGCWYINIAIAESAPTARPMPASALALTALASLPAEVEIPPFCRNSEEKLATIQRANKRRRSICAQIHAKIANRRTDFLDNSARR